MMSAPIYTQGLNGMMYKQYSQKDIGRMTAPDRTMPKQIQQYMAFNIKPERGDMAEVRKYFAAQEATDGWTRAAVMTPKRKTTDELMREFLVKSLDKANERRSMKDAETDMPFHGVVAAEDKLQHMAEQTFPHSKTGKVGVKNKAAFNPEVLLEKRARSAFAAGKENKEAAIAKRRETFTQFPDPVAGVKRGAGALGGSPPATKRMRRDDDD